MEDTYHTLKYGKKCPNDPWKDTSGTLEWTVSSPPPFHSYDKIPEVK